MFAVIFNELCLPFGLAARTVDRLDELVGARRKVKRQGQLCRASDFLFRGNLAIRTGSFKTDVLLKMDADR